MARGSKLGDSSVVCWACLALLKKNENALEHVMAVLRQAMASIAVGALHLYQHVVACNSLLLSQQALTEGMSAMSNV